MMKKEKIIQFLGGLDQGGAESVVRDYSIELTKRGYDVLVPLFYSTPDSPNQKAVVGANIKIDVFRGIYSRNIAKRVYNKLLSVIFYDEKRLRKLIKEFRPDVIHIHGYTLGCFSHLDKELENVRLYYTCHSNPEEFFSGKWKHQYYIAKRLIKRNQLQLIALHEEMADELNKMFGIDNTLILNNPIDLSKFYSNDNIDKRALRERYGIPVDAFVIGHVGRFDLYKNHTFILDVFMEVKKHNPKVFLLLVAASGGETYDKTVKRIKELGISESVKILLDRSDLPDIYRLMDVFIFPSLVEGFGLAFLEAQASGLKCLISDRIPQFAIVSENVCQLKLELSAKEWAAKIIQEEDFHMTHKMRIEEYNLKTVVDNLEIVYRFKR